MARPAKVNDEHLEEARLLRELWEARPEPRLTQDAFGSKFDIGGQSAVWRFLNGRDPLSLKAARGFAKGLNRQISEFSSRLAKEVGLLAPLVDSEVLDLTKLNRSELQLVELFRGLVPSSQHALLVHANNLYTAEHQEPSRANPFAKAPPPGETTKAPHTLAGKPAPQPKQRKRQE
jgi:hypothetical protein